MVASPVDERDGLVEPGETAPDFTLPDLHGTPVRLSELQGAPVLLVFFPGAFSAVCSQELADLGAVDAVLRRSGTRLVAVTCDASPAQRTWTDQAGADVLMLSDFWPHGAVARRYGAFQPATGTARRASVLVDAHGVVTWSVLVAPGQVRPLALYEDAVQGLAGR